MPSKGSLCVRGASGPCDSLANFASRSVVGCLDRFLGAKAVGNRLQVARPAGIIDRVAGMEPSASRSSHRELLQRERRRILEFLAQRGARDVRVFGSVARGEEDLGRSDIDLLIDLAKAGSAGGELLTVLGLSEELSELLGVRVDVVTPRTLRADVRELALAEAVPL